MIPNEAAVPEMIRSNSVRITSVTANGSPHSTPGLLSCLTLRPHRQLRRDRKGHPDALGRRKAG